MFLVQILQTSSNYCSHERKVYIFELLISSIMGQQEVYNFLKKNRSKWFTSKEIASGLDVSLGSVTNNLKKLRQSKEIMFKESPERKNMYLYKFKA